MKITSAEFVKSVVDPAQLPKEPFPQIAFVGRSNVGKSTLLNSLLNQRRLAFVSSTPGKTQMINFYNINNRFYFVDLPGYGYAKSSKSLRESWQGLIEPYLEKTPGLVLVVMLIDIRHPLSTLDEQLLEWLQERPLHYSVVATKADKLSRAELQKNLALLASHTPALQGVIAFSAKTGLGKEELWRLLRRALEGKK
ncbi:YihA family ribosome biogenesis GTP-binding protein [bacterium]|nr:YihA family ribosome biogenesis GTP-binding protein [bacterium]